MIDANRRLPENFNGVDTWFSLNPGEGLKLPDALVVEPVDAIDSGEVVKVDGDEVKSVSKESYSQSEIEEIAKLAKDLGMDYFDLESADAVKEIALRMAMEKVGVPVDLMDRPSEDGHGMSSWNLNRRIARTGYALGIKSGIHHGTPEYHMERDSFFRMRDFGRGQEYATLGGENLDSYNHAPIEARRLALANGAYPARPAFANEKEIATESIIPPFTM